MTEEKKERGQIMFRPAGKKWFGLKRRESNFELFAANCMIEMLVALSDIHERLESIEAQTKQPEPKATKKKAKKKKVSKK